MGKYLISKEIFADLPAWCFQDATDNASHVMYSVGMETEYLHLPIREIGQRLSDLRIIDPRAEAAMERSMRQFGQMTPAVVC